MNPQNDHDNATHLFRAHFSVLKDNYGMQLIDCITFDPPGTFLPGQFESEHVSTLISQP